jgi:7,8-dihydropterin-6-yl-methyl-4-(beta-D-ribofuranosyl)aminobenzene 5'-phosphate synthase
VQLLGRTIRTCVSAYLVFVGLTATASAQTPQPQRVTVLYDAFGARDAALEMDWGFAALVEYGGRRILFDTGNNAAMFERNVKRLGVDLTQLDAVVISHRHGDHTSGLTYLLQVNPAVKIFVPVEGAYFKAPIPAAYFSREAGLPVEMRYFGGRTPPEILSGTPWQSGNFVAVSTTTEIFPGLFIVSTQAANQMNELALAIRTPQGMAVVVGCSHPGVEKALESAAKIDPRLYTVTGGFHLVQTERAAIERVVALLQDTLKVQRVAPGHCTGELAFAIFMERFKDRFDRAGLGAVLALP